MGYNTTIVGNSFQKLEGIAHIVLQQVKKEEPMSQLPPGGPNKVKFALPKIPYLSFRMALGLTVLICGGLTMLWLKSQGYTDVPAMLVAAAEVAVLATAGSVAALSFNEDSFGFFLFLVPDAFAGLITFVSRLSDTGDLGSAVIYGALATMIAFIFMIVLVMILSRVPRKK